MLKVIYREGGYIERVIESVYVLRFARVVNS